LVAYDRADAVFSPLPAFRDAKLEDRILCVGFLPDR